MSRFLILLLGFVILISSAGIVSAGDGQECRLITDDFPPYASYNDGRLSGIAVAIVKELMKSTGCSGKIETLPWKRAIAYSRISKAMLFPFTRRPYREKEYKWIGPILKDRFVFAVCNEDTSNYTHIDDFRDLEVGVVIGTPTEHRLQELAFNHIQSVAAEKQNAMKMLGAHRIDAWYSTERILYHTIKSLGIDPKEIRIALQDIDVEMYIAASKSIPDELVLKWQDSLDAMKDSGRYQAILEKNSREWDSSHYTNGFRHNPKNVP